MKRQAVKMKTSEEETATISSTFQVADISRPLWSVGKICDSGDTACDTDETGGFTDDSGSTGCGTYTGTTYLGVDSSLCANPGSVEPVIWDCDNVSHWLDVFTVGWTGGADVLFCHGGWI